MCVGWATTAAAQEQKLKVVFPAISETLSLPFLIAENQGWLNAEAVQVSGDANALRALLSGGADVAIVGDFNVFSAAAENAQIRAIGSWQGVQDYQMVVDTKINTFQDMVGKTFASTGPGAPPEEFSKLVFKKHGIDPAQIQYIAVGGGGHATLLQSVLAGRASGTLVTTSNALQGMKGGKVKILTGVAQEFPKLGYVYSVVRTDELKDPAKRAALQAFVLASIKASRYIADHPADAAKFAVQKFPASDPDVLTKSIMLLTQQKVWGVNGGIEPDATTETLRIARSTGLLKKDLPPGQVFDTQLVDAAIAQVGPSK
jgi:ABC-type nitrate/sulfonate/bicarbonate transport system substrate-binding protein